MKTPNGINLMELLVKLYAEQEGVEIEGEVTHDD